MRKLVTTGILALFAVITTDFEIAYAAEGNWKYTKADKFVRYATPGQYVYGHQFGFVKQAGACDRDILWVTFSSSNPQVALLTGKEITLRFAIDGSGFEAGITLENAGQLSPQTTIVNFTNFLAGRKFIKSLNRGRKLKILIVGPNDAIDLFDIGADEFELDGFNAARRHAHGICTKELTAGASSTDEPDKQKRPLSPASENLSARSETLQANANNRDMKRFRDEESRISFAYLASRWHPTTAAESATRHVVVWRGKQSGGHVASCYLQTNRQSWIARVGQNMIHHDLDRIVDGFMEGAKIRDPEAVLLRKETTFADNYPAVLVERQMRVRSLDLDTSMTLVGLITSWRGFAVLLECGYSDVVRGDERTHDFVRGQIMRVLRTLHFER